MGDEKSRRECWYELKDAMAAEILFLLVILFIALNIPDITTTTALICCGLYGFIVENNFKTNQRRFIMTQDQFTNSLVNMVDAKIAELLVGKPADKKSINFFDAISISSMIKNVFIKRIEKIPPQIETLCNMCEAILAPTAAEKTKRLKAVVGIGGTVSGLAMIIGAIGTALGWGAGIVAAVTAFFVGTSLVGPVGWGAAGVALAAICGYLALSGDEVVDSERYIRAFKDGLLQAIPSIWQENGEQLSK